MTIDATSSLGTTAVTTTGTGVAVADAEPTVTVAKRASTTNLDYVFDDPADGEPGRDRMLVHGLWELVLVLALAGVGYLLYRVSAASFSGNGLRTLLVTASALGLVAAAAAVALRAGVPNLAVGFVAAAGGLYYGQHANGGIVPVLLVVVGVSALVGAVQGLATVGLQVPSWAVSVAVGLGVFVWANRQASVSLTGGYDPSTHAYYWFGGLFAVSIIAGLIGLFPSLRRAFGRFRPVADPAHRRGALAAVIAVTATVASTILAGVGGVLAVTVSDRVAASDGLEVTAIALGAALLGGTSAYGRRGGIFGTVFAVGLITVVDKYLTVTNRHWGTAALAAVAIGVGLVVTRLVERFGRPDRGADEDTEGEDWTPTGHAAPGFGSLRPEQHDTGAPIWKPAAATTTTTTGGLWASDEAWTSAERR
jgi:ribose/xylose/arabinose/galactoside ABC-type transport system permease subunit